MEEWWADFFFLSKNRRLSISGMLSWSHSQRARWIQLSARTSPAAPHPSCHLWPGDRPRWSPRTRPRWWQCPQCLSTSFAKPRPHHWKGGRKEKEAWFSREAESAAGRTAFTHRHVRNASPLFCAFSCRAADCPHGRPDGTATARQIFAQTSAEQLQYPRHGWDSGRNFCLCSNAESAALLQGSSAQNKRGVTAEICESAAFSCPGTPSSSSRNFIRSARYALTLGGSWN